MANASGQWDDLRTRVGSAVVMVLVAGLCIWLGGLAFSLLVAVLCGVMHWELLRMPDPQTTSARLRGVTPVRFGAIAGLLSLTSGSYPTIAALLLATGPALLLFAIGRSRPVVAFSVAVMMAGLGFVGLRDLGGAPWMLWLVLVVAATDVAGYFAGRLIGGAKLWPRVSPRKTWSGAVAGWIAAAGVGAAFAAIVGGGGVVIVASVLLSVSSQAGDIAESALKRRAGVKDSSELIPGHGGVLDRFDGMVGAALVFFIFSVTLGSVLDTAT